MYTCIHPNYYKGEVVSVYLSNGPWVNHAKTIKPILINFFTKMPNIPGSDGDGGGFGSRGG